VEITLSTAQTAEGGAMSYYDDYNKVENRIKQGATYEDIKDAVADLDSRNPSEDD
jgi:hypothetical protein